MARSHASRSPRNRAQEVEDAEAARVAQAELVATWESWLSDEERANWAKATLAERADLERLTPFARTLQLWLNTQGARGMKRAALARLAGIGDSTVNQWFSRGILPDPENFYKLLDVEIFAWSPEKLRALTGYATMPPRIVDMWQYLADRWRDEPDYGNNETLRVRVLNQLRRYQQDYATYRAEQLAGVHQHLRPMRRGGPRRRGEQGGQQPE